MERNHIQLTHNGPSDNRRVQIDMSREDFDFLLLMLGYATGAFLSHGGEEAMYRCIKFVNHLNATNPEFRQYEIPEEFRQ